MVRNKLKHFIEMKSMPRVFEPAFSSINFRGKWRAKVFKREAAGKVRTPLILELACGRGDYTVALAERFKDRDFVGIDVKGARMWHGCRMMLERGLNNVAFLRICIEDLLDHFAEGEVDEIWLTFPDPQPGKESKRLTAPRFLEMYRKVLKPGGLLHLKHDDADFFSYSLEVVPQCGFEVVRLANDVYRGHDVRERGQMEDALLTEIQTTYEKRHLAEGRVIRYACWKCLAV